MENEEELRSLKMNRVGKVSEPLEDRLYQPETPDSPTADIEIMKTAFKGRFDLIVLHDVIDPCMLLNMATGEVNELPCRIHHRPEVAGA